MRYSGALALLLLIVAAQARAGPEEDAVVRSVEDFRAVLADDPGKARRAFHALLATHPPPGELLKDLAQAYSEEQDSLLIRDLSFAGSTTEGDRRDWLEAIALDEEGALLRAQHLRGGGEDSLARSADRFRRAIAIYERVGDLRREAVARGSLGMTLWYSGDLVETRKAYEKALETRRALGDSVLIGRTLNGLGSVCNGLDEYDGALDYYRQAAEVRERIGDMAGLGTTLTYIGTIHEKRNDLARAYDFYMRGLRVSPLDSPRRVEAQENLANVLGELGDWNGVVDLYQEAKRQYEAQGNRLQLATTRTNLGISLVKIGDYSGALGELLPAVADREALGDSIGMAISLNALSETYLKIGDSSRAAESAQRAQSIADELGNHAEARLAMTNLGDANRLSGDLDAALSRYGEALKYAQADRDSVGIGAVIARMGDVRQLEGKHEKARALYRQAFDLFDHLGFRSDAEDQRVNVGNTLNALGRIRQGRARFAEAIEWGTRAQDPSILWPAYLGLADGFELEGQLDSARVYNDLAIGVIEGTWGGQLSGDLKASFVGGKAFVYEAQVNVLARLRDRSGGENLAEEALRVAERAKARALRDLLQEARVDPSASVSSELAAARDSLDREMSSVQYRIRCLDGDASAADRRQLETQWEELERDRRQVDDRIRLDNPHLAALDVGQVASVDELRRSLLPDSSSALLEYSLGDSASYLWVVTSGSTVLHRLPPRADIESATRSFRAQLTEPTSDDDGRGLTLVRTETVAPDRLLQEGTALHAMLLGPAGADLDGLDLVYIVPDGILHYLPFEALPARALEPDAGRSRRAGTGHGRDPPYAFRNARVHYGPSATTLLALASGRREEASRSLLALGDPAIGGESTLSGTPGADLATSHGAASTRSELAELPFSRAEVLAIGDLFPADGRVILLDRDAQEGKLRDVPLERFGILHFATHGVIDEDHPSRSHLVLSFPESPGEDGYLQASEIYDLRIGADLVVLSACETGLGRMVRGEGVLGLPRAFLFAGARSVIVSLWSVSDRSTSEFMQRFYRSLMQEGDPPAAALRKARISLRREPQYAHPYFWAGFVLIGPGGGAH